MIATAIDPADDRAVSVTYRLDDTDRRIQCTFSGSGMDRDRLLLAGVTVDDTRRLTGIKLQMLRIWLRLNPLTMHEELAGQRQSVARHIAYASQQAVNAANNAAIYALLAVGFTMLYGVLGKMFMAFGQIMMAGAFGAIVGGSVSAGLGLGDGLVLALGLACAIFTGAAISLSSGRMLGPVLHARNSQAALVATIGLSLVLQEFVRLTQGAREIWLQPPFPRRMALFDAGGFDVSIGSSTLVILGLAGAVFGLVACLLRTRFGLQYRACVDDIGMAALLGVRVPSVTAFVMLIGGVSAGCAGAVIALLYGGISFATGTLLGLKALTAAVVGGIGSIRGAALGAILIALVETVSVGYLSPAYKDIAVFIVLVAVLIWRPQGIAGRPQGRGD